MAITIEQIATHTGLCRQTISRILNNRNAHLYAVETQRRVRAACKELGYQPNAVSRAMRNGRFDALGLLASVEANRSYVPWQLMAGIQGELTKHGLHLVYSSLPDRTLLATGVVPRLLQELMADGLMVAYNQDIPEPVLEMIRRHQIPSVWINADMETDCVSPDDFAASRTATQQLIDLGHRRIAYLDLLRDEGMIRRKQGHFSLHARLDGYRQAMADAGLKPQTIFAAHGHRHMSDPMPPVDLSWLSTATRPTALVSYSFYGMHSIMTYCACVGMRIPQDLSLVTFGETVTRLDDGVIDTMVHPNDEIGRQAVRMTLEKIQDPSRVLPALRLPFAPNFGVTTATAPETRGAASGRNN